ncbi:hypothetical protein, partial [Xanthomonas citri]|uniref:hypothetical protein n=1 Tax=Xanthomonas citri TaxID=346 RepID=UPI001A8D0BC6
RFAHGKQLSWLRDRANQVEVSGVVIARGFFGSGEVGLPSVCAHAHSEVTQRMATENIATLVGLIRDPYT